MRDWIGPAIVAAVVSGLVTIFGWFVSSVQNSKQDAKRRKERVIDVQTALTAEIRSFYARARNIDVAAHGNRMKTWIMEGDGGNTPFVPQEPDFLIYKAIAPEIHILPQPVIDPVVLFYTQASTLSLFASDLRGERYRSLDATSKNEMYQDYLALMEYAFQLAGHALHVLEESLSYEQSQ